MKSNLMNGGYILKKKQTILWTSILFLMAHSLYLSAQVNLQITTSRTTGVAPLYVFFDATLTTGLTDTNDLVNADFSWNFDLTNVDPTGTWEITKGMVAGHVFEAPGTYTIQCVVTHPDGTTDTETVSITATAFTGTTYYVSALGDDANDGLSENSPWQTANFAFSQLGADEQILFNRDETFTNVDYNLQNLSGGKMIIGAYGSGNKPILSGALDENILELDFVDDIAFMDLHLDVNTSTGGVGNFSIEDCSEVLLLNLELEGSTSLAVYNDACDLVGVFDTYIHDFGVLATFAGGGTRLSWVGNTIDNLIGTPQPEHGMRIQGGEKQFIAHNSLTNLIETKSAIQIRGDGQRHVMLYKNKMDRIFGVNPTNAATVQAISFVTLEGNYVGQNPDYTGTSWENSNNGINIEATNIAVRNNVIDGYRNAINVSHDYNGVVSGMVDIYNNTANWRAVSPQSNTSGRIVNVRDVSNVKVRNNMISAPNMAQAEIISYGGTNTNIFVSDNLATETPGYVTNPLPGSAAHLNFISHYQLTAASPAINAGNNDIPVFYDQMNVGKPVGNFKDVGAFEFPTALPVELVNFWGTHQEGHIHLHWQTAAERDNDGFYVEKSTDAIEWENIGFVEGAGYSPVFMEYKFIDEKPKEGINYYRLKQLDFDGGQSYSGIISVEVERGFSFNLYPNPASGRIFLEGDMEGHIISLYRAGGQLINSDINDSILDLSNLQEGVYLIQVLDKHSRQAQSFKILKK